MLEGIVDVSYVVELSLVFGVGQTEHNSEGSTSQSIVNIANAANESANKLSYLLVCPGVAGYRTQQGDLGICFQGHFAVVETDPAEAAVVTAQENLICAQILIQHDNKITVPLCIGTLCDLLCGIQAGEGVCSFQVRAQTFSGRPSTIATPRQIHILIFGTIHNTSLRQFVLRINVFRNVNGLCIINDSKGREGCSFKGNITGIGVVDAINLSIDVIQLNSCGIQSGGNLQLNLNRSVIVLLQAGNLDIVLGHFHIGSNGEVMVVEALGYLSGEAGARLSSGSGNHNGADLVAIFIGDKDLSSGTANGDGISIALTGIACQLVVVGAEAVVFVNELTGQDADVESNGVAHVLIFSFLVHMYGQSKEVLLTRQQNNIFSLSSVGARINLGAVTSPSLYIAIVSIGSNCIAHNISQAVGRYVGNIQSNLVLQSQVAAVLDRQVDDLSHTGFPSDTVSKYGVMAV